MTKARKPGAPLIVPRESRIKVGCCGFRRSRADYFKHFSLVEVQHTFYQPPKRETLEKWHTEAPEGFEFTLKAWQMITHDGDSPTYKRLKSPLSSTEHEECGSFKSTPTVDRAMEVTLECAAALRSSKILFQCPARFTPSDENIERLQEFFSNPRPEGMTYLWEPRGAWPEALIAELCEACNLTHVVNPFNSTPVTGPPYYFRLHGRQGMQKHDAASLEELKETATGLSGEVYVLFNNVWMLDDARAFRGMLDRASGDPTSERVLHQQ